MPLQPGTRLGPYEVLSLIGTGGMGEVYRGRDTRLDRPVALKILAPDLASDAAFRDRFTREARAISALNHAHICGLHDIGREHDTDICSGTHSRDSLMALAAGARLGSYEIVSAL
jgi:eukaryotic-like serine/threonine-protein kinase